MDGKIKNLNIEKNRFVKSIIEKTNLNPNCVFDIYGFTEQLGRVYPSFSLRDVT